jgi:hypothetical protein
MGVIPGAVDRYDAFSNCCCTGTIRKVRFPEKDTRQLEMMKGLLLSKENVVWIVRKAYSGVWRQ